MYLPKIDDIPAREFIRQKLQTPVSRQMHQHGFERSRMCSKDLPEASLRSTGNRKTVRPEQLSSRGSGTNDNWDSVANEQTDWRYQNRCFHSILSIWNSQKLCPAMLDGAEGIILDLRANGGGDAEAMADLVSPFLDDGTGLGKFVDRLGASFELHAYRKRLWPSTPATDLPIVILTSESTASAAEIMASVLQTKRGARSDW
jgi:hypothetical protein